MWQLLVEVYIYPLDEVLHRSSEPPTDNGFELVQSTLVEDTEINVLINIHVQHTAGEHAVYRATPMAQIAEGGTMRKQHKISNTRVLVSERRVNFDEVSLDAFAAH